MPKGIKGFQKGHESFLSEESRKKIGAFHKGKKHSDDWKKKIGDSNKRAYSEGRKSVKGNKNPAWKGGITSEQQRVRRSLEYVIWRDEVWKRDYWTCRICKIKCRKGNIVAHHLKLFSEFPELRFIVDNGITLCRACHIKVHRHNLEY